MAAELTLTDSSNISSTLVGAWELRAGSHDTTEWLDGAADVGYPGGGPGTFQASNSDGANGYDPAPKMALINFTTGRDDETITLAGGISTVLGVWFSETDSTPLGDAHASNNHQANVSYSGKVLTLHVTGSAGSYQAVQGNIMVMYN